MSGLELAGVREGGMRGFPQGWLREEILRALRDAACNPYLSRKRRREFRALVPVIEETNRLRRPANHHGLPGEREG